MSQDFWERVAEDDRLQNVRRRLSIHELRMLYQHARASILDAMNDRQEMTGPGRWVVINGELIWKPKE